jgi:crossover junction endodeoxyribonuclease RusA
MVQITMPNFPKSRTAKACLIPKSAKPRKPREEPRSDRLRIVSDPLTVRLPYPPSVNDYWKFNRSFGSVYIAKEGKVFRENVLIEWRRQTGDVTFGGGHRLAMRVEVVFPDKRDRDLDNILKATLDALQYAGAYQNDKHIKLLIVENSRVESPGWIDVTIGRKPGLNQGTLFSVDW